MSSDTDHKSHTLSAALQSISWQVHHQPMFFRGGRCLLDELRLIRFHRLAAPLLKDCGRVLTVE